jgi:hypothetical protein
LVAWLLLACFRVLWGGLSLGSSSLPSLPAPFFPPRRLSCLGVRTPRQLVAGLLLYFCLTQSWGFVRHCVYMAPNLSNPSIVMKGRDSQGRPVRRRRRKGGVVGGFLGATLGKREAQRRLFAAEPFPRSPLECAQKKNKRKKKWGWLCARPDILNRPILLLRCAFSFAAGKGDDRRLPRGVLVASRQHGT